MNNPSISDAVGKIVKTIRSCKTRPQLEHAYAWGRNCLLKASDEIGADRFTNYLEIISHVYRVRSFQIWEGSI